jgi:hypothetical protein
VCVCVCVCVCVFVCLWEGHGTCVAILRGHVLDNVAIR